MSEVKRFPAPGEELILDPGLLSASGYHHHHNSTDGT